MKGKAMFGAAVAAAVMAIGTAPAAAQTQKLGEEMFQSGDNSNYGAMFANKITVDCPR